MRDGVAVGTHPSSTTFAAPCGGAVTGVSTNKHIAFYLHT